MQGQCSRRRSPDFNQPRCRRLLQKVEQITLAPFRLDLVFFQESVANVRDRSRLLEQVPDTRPDPIETVIPTSLQIEEDDFAIEVTGNLVLRGGNNGG